MNILGIPILTLVTFFPVAGMALVLALPGSRGRAIKLVANVFTGLEFAATLLLLTRFDASSGDMQFLERAPWIKAIGAQYLLGIDGISLLLVLLTSLLTFIAILSSWQAVQKRLKEYYVFLLLLEMGMIGVFLSLDLLLFYVFWEVVLVPMYFLIGVWGGERRLYAAIKLFLYTLFGSVAMLVGILILRSECGTFDVPVVVNRVKPHTDFRGENESGLVKMMVIGMAKHQGALMVHRLTIKQGFPAVIKEVSSIILKKLPILFGVGMSENQYGKSAFIELLKVEVLVQREKALLKKARKLMPSLPFEQMDILILDEMGKNISGAGMDSNVIGRRAFIWSQKPRKPKITRIFVRDLTEESHGNATGIGMADYITKRLFETRYPSYIFRYPISVTLLKVCSGSNPRPRQWLRACLSRRPRR